MEPLGEAFLDPTWRRTFDERSTFPDFDTCSPWRKLEVEKIPNLGDEYPSPKKVNLLNYSRVK